MTGIPDPAASPGSSPGTPGPTSPAAPWYRRRVFLLVVGVVVVVAVAVISDLPTGASRSADIQAETTVIGQINTDIAPCVFAVHEAQNLYSRETSDTVTSADRAQIPGLLRDDLDACSLTDQSIYDLSDVESPGGAAGDRVADALNTATVWTTSDAVGVIATIQALHERAQWQGTGPVVEIRAPAGRRPEEGSGRNPCRRPGAEGGQPPAPDPVHVAGREWWARRTGPLRPPLLSNEPAEGLIGVLVATQPDEEVGEDHGQEGAQGREPQDPGAEGLVGGHAEAATGHMVKGLVDRGVRQSQHVGGHPDRPHGHGTGHDPPGTGQAGHDGRRLDQLEPQPDPGHHQGGRFDQGQPAMTGQGVDAAGCARPPARQLKEHEGRGCGPARGAGDGRRPPGRPSGARSSTAMPSASVSPVDPAARPRSRHGAPSTTRAGTPMASRANCRASKTSMRRASEDRGGTEHRHEHQPPSTASGADLRTPHRSHRS